MRALNRELNLEIEREYARRRNLAHAQSEERRKRIHAKYPRIKITEELIRLRGLDYLQSTFNDDEEHRWNAYQSLKEVEDELRSLLRQYGVTNDYAEPLWHCEKCQDKGLIGDYYCSCYEELRRDKLAALLPSAIIEEANFSNFDLSLYPEEIEKDGQIIRPRDYMATLKDIVSTYSRHFSLLENRNLFFSGQEGSGKTWLISCLTAEVSKQGYSVFMLPAASFFDLMREWHQLKNSYKPDPDRYKEMELLTEALWDCDLLVLDDLGTEIQKDTSYTDLLLLLDHRHRDKLHTVIASNLSANDLRRIYDKRIASRISGNFLCYQLPPVDLRLVKSDQDF
ncbi:MAG TPA: ATP-binding protein [Clostridiaceae bacterium]|nr:ATP-binding protein [Clostridiaceae bacterium]